MSQIITLAPELDGMDDFIDQLNKLEINIQFGHSLEIGRASCRERV